MISQQSEAMALLRIGDKYSSVTEPRLNYYDVSMGSNDSGVPNINGAKRPEKWMHKKPRVLSIKSAFISHSF